MSTKRERLDTLTSYAWQLIDDAHAADTVSHSLAAIDVDITSAQNEISALVAVSNRSAAQNVELRCLRRILSGLRGERKLVRDSVALSRLILALDGSRLRDSDVGGSD